MHRFTDEYRDLPCPYKKLGCTFVGASEPAWETHNKMHGSWKKPKAGSQAEFNWLMLGLTEEGVRYREQWCPLCESRKRGSPRYQGLELLRDHIRAEHPELVSGCEDEIEERLRG